MSDALVVVDRLRKQVEADRSSPAVPLLLLALVVTGAIVVSVVRDGQVAATGDGSAEFVPIMFGPGDDPVRLGYWIIASILAYAAALWIARRQGYRRGLWVDRLPLLLGGLGALLIAVVATVGWYGPGDLFIRGNVPLLAVAVGVIVWAMRERRPGLWAVAVVTALLSLLANLYDMENLLFRLGVPVFDGVDDIANLGAVALALFIAAGAYGVLGVRRRPAPDLRSRA
jgi:hypothetical protein